MSCQSRTDERNYYSHQPIHRYEQAPASYITVRPPPPTSTRPIIARSSIPCNFIAAVVNAVRRQTRFYETVSLSCFRSTIYCNLLVRARAVLLTFYDDSNCRPQHARLYELTAGGHCAQRHSTVCNLLQCAADISGMWISQISIRSSAAIPVADPRAQR